MVSIDATHCFLIIVLDSNPRGSAGKEKLPVASFLRRAVKSGTKGEALGRRAISMCGLPEKLYLLLFRREEQAPPLQDINKIGAKHTDGRVP